MVGQNVGSYRIVEQIGAGGMGQVYLAVHNLLGSKAAIKVLRREYTTRTDVVNRFFNEAKAIAAIQHPGIVQVFDFGHDPADGSAYIVMEFLAGETLRSRLRRVGRLTVSDATRIALHCASALSAAHQVGVIHRDLKPDNIFLVPDPQVTGGERSKILDFGIAKLSGEYVSSGIETTTGSIMGTPIYMSPEQCRGCGSIDLRTDIYSLGCMIFHMLAGRPPFDLEGAGEVIAAHLKDQAPALDVMVPDLPRSLGAVVKRALEKEPDYRFATMQTMAAALLDAGQTMPLPTGDPGALLTPPRIPSMTPNGTMTGHATPMPVRSAGHPTPVPSSGHRTPTATGAPPASNSHITPIPMPAAASVNVAATTLDSATAQNIMATATRSRRASIAAVALTALVIGVVSGILLIDSEPAA
ncbi:MAG: protein kinase, partial [Myxococcota bacterium]